MGRYWDVIKASWSEQSANRKPMLNKDEREFQAAAIEILETPASPAGRTLAFLIMAFAVIAVAWSIIGRIDVHSTLQGKIIPSGKVKVIEPLITGTIKAIRVKPGSRVAQGDVLLELDPTEHAADRTKLEEELGMLELTSVRLLTALDAVANETPARDAELEPPEDAPREMVVLQQSLLRQSLIAYEAERASIQAEIDQREREKDRVTASVSERDKLIALTAERSDIFAELHQQGFGSKARALDAAQLLQDQTVALVEEQGRLAEVKAGITALEKRMIERREAYADKAITELADAEARISAARQDLTKALLRERQSTLIAPVAGRVQQLAVHTVGDVVTTGQQLMVIVPEGTTLEVEAMLLNKDKGFVEEGQTVRIKVETFPFTKYGTISGEVMHVSNDAVSSSPQGAGADQNPAVQQAAGPLVFPVRISLEAETIAVDGADVSLTPGMSVSAEIKTDERRVIEFILTPLLKFRDEALHER